MKLRYIFNQFKPAVKVFWWKMADSQYGNFGDEITSKIITAIFNRKVEWSLPNSCDMIGAGSILAETYKHKGENKPYVWSSGFIEASDLRLQADDFKFVAVRGTTTLSRIDNISSDKIVLGDIGLLASYLVKPDQQKKYKLGVLPHYHDKNLDIINSMSKMEGVVIIDATWPCIEVVKTIAQCESVLSSSLHGLIVADSVGTPNKHFPISDKVEGGTYKFLDYYSAFKDHKYSNITAKDITGMDAEAIRDLIKSQYNYPSDLVSIKKALIKAFPFK